MHKKLLESTQKKGQKLKSPMIRQTSSGQKVLKATSRGQKLKKDTVVSRQKIQNKLTISHSPKNKKIEQKSVKNQAKNNNLKVIKTQTSKQKNRAKIISYKTLQSENKNKQQELKKSVIDIQLPCQDSTINDEINLMSISNYHIEDNDFLRQTHITPDLSKSKYAKLSKQGKIKKEKSQTKLYKNSSKKSTDQLVKTNRGKLLTTKLAASNKGSLQKSGKGEAIKIKKTNRGLSQTKKGKKQKSSSSDTKKGQNSKKKRSTNVKISKSPPVPKKIPKSIPKPQKSSSREKKSQKKIPSKINAPKHEQESSSDTTNVPSFQQLQKLREQNQKYKMFLASSAFKVQELKRQIEQSKQVRQTQRSMYNYQLNNLKKQVDANKKYLGHLYSYQDSNTQNNFLPQQIILETDNQSSIQDSINMLSKVSKRVPSDQLISGSNSNKIKQSNSGIRAVANSNISLSNLQDQNEQKLAKIDMLESITKDTNPLKDSQSLDFLFNINKIPSLAMNISLEQSDREFAKRLQVKSPYQGQSAILKAPRLSPSSKKSSQENSDLNLLLDSKRT